MVAVQDAVDCKKYQQQPSLGPPNNGSDNSFDGGNGEDDQHKVPSSHHEGKPRGLR